MGIKIESIPGPSAIITALTLSGLPTDKFIFWGFSPKSHGKRINFFNEIKNYKNFTHVFYESPHRVTESLEDMTEAFGDIEIVVCREMTKVYEEVTSDKISSQLKKINPKGEFTVVFRA